MWRGSAQTIRNRHGQLRTSCVKKMNIFMVFRFYFKTGCFFVWICTNVDTLFDESQKCQAPENKKPWVLRQSRPRSTIPLIYPAQWSSILTNSQVYVAVGLPTFFSFFQIPHKCWHLDVTGLPPPDLPVSHIYIYIYTYIYIYIYRVGRLNLSKM